ncbi:DUF1043 domain-containing protein [Aliidiomarina sedimenti]|uniref:Z-ring associated protein G n=1 Tax=Aliidiomarina sedimenti TaxID=1933879 RepID=A0ABY0BZU1_9GAMM|nr:DUF1043 family protein [Aliidiomarina sedimenti]RUO30587.1 DUF1043 domain-containing protein [Aliidiomarina sedimenti]
MDWLIGLLLVVVGAVIGFFAARYYLSSHSDSAQLEAQVAANKEQFDAYRKDVFEHFETARQLAEDLNDTQTKLNAFLSDSQQLLQQEKEWQQPLPFFSADTIRQLRAAKALDNDQAHPDRPGDAAPRDYSEGGSSGLFRNDEDYSSRDRN